MTHETVIQMIEAYRLNVGRVEHLENLVSVYSASLKRMEGNKADMMAGGAQVISGMPHGSTTGDPTSRMGLMLADGYVPEIMADLIAELEAANAELQEKRPAVVFVWAWLKGLTDKECWMIEGKMISGKSWEEMRAEHVRQYHVQCSKATLKRLKATALDKIFEMAR